MNEENKTKRRLLYESLVNFFLDETAKLEQQRIDRPTIFVTMIKVAWVIGLSALALEELEMLDKAAKRRVVKSFEAANEQARRNEN